ncbi:MAG: hypothetical protein HN704_18475 [Bacteroidetes bacterium]|jgi:hypothetical protein|nr:hypothetical protein [Bacteroidota bacterium]MBT6686083.1 hypothetical protein [Bacteroidota bacterium]MBT7142024.1 hypothetical protein [Bacteroidota bacterium]MBT7493590.1 hypothetical protein [Bacteroidota bacterium]
MKRAFYFLTLSFFVVIISSSCSKDPESTNQYNFLSQDLSGEISGREWIYRSGNAFSFRNDSSQQMLDIALYEHLSLDPCNYAFTGNDVLFIIPNKTGLYELQLNFSENENIQTLTITNDEQENMILSEGAIEIFSIDTVYNIMKGRIDAKYDNDNFVNGIFEVLLCE